MENKVSTNNYMLLIKGIIMVLLAILIFMSPGDALMAYVLYIGIGFTIAGVVRIIQGFGLKGKLENWGWVVFEGVMDIILGYILMAHPGMTVAILPFLIGFWAAVYGLFLVIDGFSMKEGRGIKIVSGILLFLLANVIMFNPLFFGLTMAIWVGIMLLFAGIYNVIAFFTVK